MSNQAFSKIWIVIIFIILIAGGILAWQYFGAPKEEAKVPEEIAKDETASWKIYRNEGFGFEVKYPEDWTVEVKDPHDLCWAGPQYSCLASIQFSPPLSSTADYREISLIILSNPEKYSAIKWINEYTPEILNDPSFSMYENIRIGKEEWVKTVIADVTPVEIIPGVMTTPREISFLIVKEENFFGLGTRLTGEWEKTEDILNQMLSTFRFLD